MKMFNLFTLFCWLLISTTIVLSRIFFIEEAKVMVGILIILYNLITIIISCLILYNLRKSFSYLYTTYRSMLITANICVCLPQIILVTFAYELQYRDTFELKIYFLGIAFPLISWMMSLVFGHIRQKETVNGDPHQDNKLNVTTEVSNNLDETLNTSA